MAFFTDYIQLLLMEDISEKNIEAGLKEYAWEDIVRLFSVHEVRKKKVGRFFIPASFKPKKEWVYTSHALDESKATLRNEDNIESITMAVLDLDEKGAIDQAKEIFKDFSYIVYSTHSYTSETPYKFRMILQLSEPIPKKKWPACFASLMAGVNGDNSCGNLSRLYFTPSHAENSDIPPVFYENKGRVLTMDDILRIGREHGFRGLSQKVSSEYEPKKIVHFSGRKEIESSHYIKKNSFSYEEMEKRHESVINSVLTENRRHDFALRVVSSEVAKFKNNVDLYRVVQFLIIASREYSSKCLLKGNTLSELPEMISSAFSSFARSEIKDVEQSYGLPLMDVIKNEIEAAKVSVISNNIKDESPYRKSEKPLKDSSDVFEYKEFKKKNMKALKAFLNDGDPKKLFVSTMKNDLLKDGLTTNTMRVMEYLFYCVVQQCRFSPQGKSNQFISTAVDNAIQSIKEEACDIAGKINDENALQKLYACVDVAGTISKKVLSGEKQWIFAPSHSKSRRQDDIEPGMTM